MILPLPIISGKLVEYRVATQYGTQVIKINHATPNPRITTYIENGYEQFPYSLFLDEVLDVVAHSRLVLGLTL